MTEYAEIQYLRNTDLWKSYTPEWRESLIKETPEIEWKYWLKRQPWRDCPFVYLSYFCNQHNTGYWKHNSAKNFRTCVTCGKLPLDCWALFIFECDECEQPFMIKRYPVHYQLCEDCGGE